MAGVNRKATILCPVTLAAKATAWFAKKFPAWRVTFDVPVTADAKVASEYWISANVSERNYAKLANTTGGICDFGGVLYGGSMFGGAVAKCADPEVILTKEGRARLLPTELKAQQITPKPGIDPKPRPTLVEDVPIKGEPVILVPEKR